MNDRKSLGKKFEKKTLKKKKDSVGVLFTTSGESSTIDPSAGGLPKVVLN